MNRKNKYKRYLASLMGVTMITPQVVPTVQTFAMPSKDEFVMPSKDEFTTNTENAVLDNKENIDSNKNEQLELDTEKDITQIETDESDETIESLKDSGKSKISISGITVKTNNTKEWDGTTKLSGITVSRDYDLPVIADENDIKFFNSNDLKINCDINFVDSNVGFSKKIILDNFTITGPGSERFEMEKDSYTFDTNLSITKRRLRLSVNVPDKKYDGTTDADVKITGISGIVSASSKNGDTENGLDPDKLDINISGQFENEKEGKNKKVYLKYTVNGEHKDFYEIEIPDTMGNIVSGEAELTPKADKQTNSIINVINTDEWKLNDVSQGNVLGTSIPIEKHGKYTVLRNGKEIYTFYNTGYDADLDAIVGIRPGKYYTFNDGQIEKIPYDRVETKEIGVYKIYNKDYGTDLPFYTYEKKGQETSPVMIEFKTSKPIEKEWDGTDKITNIEKGQFKWSASGDVSNFGIESYDMKYESSDVGEPSIIISNVKLNGNKASEYQKYVDGKTYKVPGRIRRRKMKIDFLRISKTYDGTDKVLFGTTENGINQSSYKIKEFNPADIDMNKRKLDETRLKLNITGNYGQTDAGKTVANLKVYLSGIDAKNYEKDVIVNKDIPGIIKKAEKNGPSKDLFTFDKKTMTISGFTDDMEYTIDGKHFFKAENGVLKVKENETIYVIYVEDKNHNRSKGTRINISDGDIPTVPETKDMLTIRFDLNNVEPKDETYSGGSMGITEGYSMNQVQKEDGSKLTLPVIQPKDSRYHFIGWFTEKTGGTKITEDTILNKVNGSTNLTFYAHYMEDELPDDPGDEIKVEQNDIIYGETLNPIANSTKGNYTNYRFEYKKTDEPDNFYTTQKPFKAGEYILKITASSAKGYTPKITYKNFKIKKRGLTLEIEAKDKIYDGNSDVIYKTKISGKILEKDNIIVPDSNSLSVHFEDKNVGLNKKIIVKNAELKGNDKDNYELFIKPNSASINKRKLEYTSSNSYNDRQFTLKANDKIYDGNAKADVSGNLIKLGSDDVNIKATGNFEDANVGNNKKVYVLKENISLVGTDANNYELILNNDTFTMSGKITALTNTDIPQAKPVNETEKGKNDGKITNVDNTMEYSKDNGITYEPITGTEITGLKPGKYRVKYKNKDGVVYNGYITVEIKEGPVKLTGEITATVQDITYGEIPNVVIVNKKGEYNSYKKEYKLHSETVYKEEIPKTPGTYDVRITGYSNKGYQNAITETSFKIKKKDFVVKIIPKDKVYDGTTGATYDVEQDQSIDMDNLQVSDGTVNFDDKNVGNNKSVNITGFTVSGNNLNYYNVVRQIGKANINKRHITANSIKPETKIYDGTNKAVINTTVVKMGTDELEIKATGEFADVNAGENKDVKITKLTLSGKDASNYVLDNVLPITLKGTISKAPDKRIPNVKFTNPTSGSNNGVISDVDTTMEYSTDGGNTFKDCPNGKITGLGTGTVRVRYKADNNHYAGNGIDITLKINVVNHMIKFITDSGEYSSTLDQTKTVSTLNIPENITKKDGYTFDGWFTDNSYQTKADLSKTVNKDTVFYGKFTKKPEEKKTVEININMPDITYGDILPNPQVKSNGDYNNFSYQYKKKGSLLWSDTKPKDVGEYEIKVIAKETNKYKQIEKITTFRINKRKLNVNINVNSKVYDGTVNVSGYSSNFSNIVKGDNITVSINQNNLKFADKNVGTNKTVNTTNAITINGSKKDNYEIGDVLAKGNITKKEITIKDVLVKDKYFDGNADTKALVSFNGIIDGDDVSSVATAKFRDANIENDKPVDIKITLTGNDKDNYNLINKKIVRTANIIKKEKNNPDIKRKEIRYTILGTDKTYDSTTKAYIKFKLRNTGSDDVNIIADCEYEDANPGEKKIFIRNIKLTGKDAYKYKLTNPVIAVSGFITKQDGKQANPVIQNETIYGKNDGSIKADNSLEYRQKGTDIFKPLDNGINNLPSGKYEIRTKETNISNAGEIKEIELVPDKVYKITIINSDGSELIKPIKYNEKLQKPDNPIKKGYQFNGWYFDKDLKEKAIFDKIYNETDLSLYPKFIKASKYSGFYSSRSDKTTGVSGTWTKDINGKWELRIGNEQIKNRWVYVRNPYFDKTKGQNEFDWFHFNKEGKMDTGWFKDIDGNTYYLHNISDNTLGHMYTGWHWIKGTDGKERCYFFKDFSDGKKGALYRNTKTPDGYNVNGNGAWTIQGNEITR